MLTAQKSKQGRDDSLQLHMAKSAFSPDKQTTARRVACTFQLSRINKMAPSHVALHNKQWFKHALPDMCVTTIMQYNSTVAFTLSTSDKIII